MSDKGSSSFVGKGTIVLILLLTSFAIMAAMPTSFYLSFEDMADQLLSGELFEKFLQYFDRIPLLNFTGNFSDFLNNFDLPYDNPINPGDYIIPPEWNIPDLDWGDLPEGWEGEIPPIMPGDLPDNFQIPDGWLPPGVDPSQYPWLLGLAAGLFGTQYIKVWVNSSNPSRYWRVRTYDTFNSSNWVQSDNTVSPYNYTNISSIQSSQKYLVWMNITYQRNGSGSLPIPHLWPSGEIMENLTVLAPVNVTWNILTDSSDAIIWNATVIENPGGEFTVSIIYNVTYDDTITPQTITAQMTSQIVDGTPFDPPGTTKYRQLPSLDPLVIQDMEKVKNMVFSKGLDVYNATMAVLEYFKTRYSFIASTTDSTQFNATRMVATGQGTNADFASNFALYLRYLNISTRLVWGGVGYLKDSSSPTPNDMYRLIAAFYTEVWIPNSTNNGGNWLQVDPTPYPNKTYGMTDYNNYELIYPRIPDDRLRTHHYDLLVLTNTSDYRIPLNHLNRNTDHFRLNATLYRDGNAIAQTLLGDTVNFTFYDTTDDRLLGYNWSIGATWTDSFNDNSISGPHTLKTSFYAVYNESIIVLNDTTNINIDSLGNPEPIDIRRGPDNSFLFYANLSDPTSNRPIEGVMMGAYIDSQPLIINNNTFTDQTGLAQLNLSVPSSVNVGYHNITIQFNGTFIVEKNFPNLAPDLVLVTAAPSSSRNHSIYVKADLIITLYKDTNFVNDIIVRNNNVTLYGRVTYDNGTAISNAPVDIHWLNSSGEFIFGHLYTNLTGWYSYKLYISRFHDSIAQVWANTTLPFVNKSTATYYYSINCQDSTILYVYPLSVGDYIIRSETTIQIRGYLIDPYDVANTSGQSIYLLNKDTGEKITHDSIITGPNGNFSSSITISSDTPVGNMNIYATFNGNWSVEGNLIDIPSSASNSSDFNVLIVAKSKFVKDTTSYNNGRNLDPANFIPIGEKLDIYGYLVLDNNSILSGKTVKAWEILPNGTTIELGQDITDGTGFYNITYNVPSSHPTGSTEIFVNFSAGSVYSSYITNASESNDPWFGYLCDLIISKVTPTVALRGQTYVEIKGHIEEIYSNTDLTGQQLYITFDSKRVRDNNYQEVVTQVDENGNFTANFIVSTSIKEEDYIVNATPASSIIKYNQSIPSNIIIKASSKIENVRVVETPLLGEIINITGTLAYENGTELNGQITVYPLSDPSKNQTFSVSGNYEISIPVNTFYSSSTSDELVIDFQGTSMIAESNTTTPIFIGDNPTITIDVPTSAYAGSTFAIYGTVSQNGHPFAGRELIITVYNSTNHKIINTKVLTNNNGEFNLNMIIPIEGNYTIIANLSSVSMSFISNTELISIIPAPNFFEMLWVLWIIIPVVIGIILAYLGVKMSVRRREKKKKQKIMERIEPNKIKDNVQALCDGKRYKEAIIYAYLSFLKIVAVYREKRRVPSQTIREFAMELVKNLKFPPKELYAFTSLYEEARFSDHSIDKDKFEEAKLLFDALVGPIMKKATLST
ncbi:MAG: transglutaminase domain-containing protein [Candidatus Helarchaeota archaeon]